MSAPFFTPIYEVYVCDDCFTVYDPAVHSCERCVLCQGEDLREVRLASTESSKFRVPCSASTSSSGGF